MGSHSILELHPRLTLPRLIGKRGNWRGKVTLVAHRGEKPPELDKVEEDVRVLVRNKAKGAKAERELPHQLLEACQDAPKVTQCSRRDVREDDLARRNNGKGEMSNALDNDQQRDLAVPVARQKGSKKAQTKVEDVDARTGLGVCPTRAGRSAATGACEQSLVSFIPLAIRVISRFARTYTSNLHVTITLSSDPPKTRYRTSKLCTKVDAKLAAGCLVVQARQAKGEERCFFL